jgi:O-antigen/teichoic acid export membrane protein
MDLRKKVLTGLGWSAGARFLGQLITWAITIIVMRLLTPGDYGLMAMAGVFIFFLTLLNELGLGAALIQRQEIDETTLRQTFGMLWVINFSLFLILLLIAPLIGSFFHEQRVVPIIRLLSIQFIMMPFAIIPQSLLTREMNFKGISIIDFVSAIAGSLITLILALSGFGVWSLVWGSMAVVVSRTIGLNVISSYLHIPIFSFKGMAQTITFGGYVTISRILWGFYTQADTFIIGKLLGKELLGFYSVGMTIATLPMEKVSGIINQVAFPAFSRIQNDSQKASSHFLKAVRVMSFLAFPVLWGMSSIAPELVAVLLGDKWKLAVLPFQLLSLVIPIRMISNLMSPAVMGLGRPDIEFFNLLFASVVIPIGILIGVHWGLLGVSLAWVILYPLVFLRYVSRVVRVLEIRMVDVFLAMARPVLGAFIMYAAVMGIRAVLGTDAEGIWYLVLLIICGAMVYGGMIVTLHRDGFREVWELTRV